MGWGYPKADTLKVTSYVTEADFRDFTLLIEQTG
jgi:hypothetical protein